MNVKLVAGHKYETLWAQIREARIWESKNEKLLGLTIDRNLNFDDHVCAKKLAENYQLRLEFPITRVLKKMNSFKSICEITVWLLPINLDVL